MALTIDVLRAILEHAPGSIVVSDSDLVVQWANRPSADAAGGDVVGSHRLSVLPSDEQPRWRSAFERAAHSGEAQRIETADGTTTITALRGAGDPGGGPVFAYVEFRGEGTTDESHDLAQLRIRLAEVSNRAGLAEVTTGTLHNVGNVLNSVNVSANSMGEILDRSRLGLLTRAVTMIREHEEGLAEFLSTDPKGQKLPALLEMLSEQLTHEHERLCSELARLTQHVELMRATVDAQQALAKVGEAVALVSIDSLLERIHSMFQIDMQRRSIEYSASTEPLGEVVLDTQSTLQILANLVRNAIAAVEGRAPPRRINVRVHTDGPQVLFEVQDNGSGIAPEHITKIFEHGFTTKPNGHGFGLHASATAARSMRGSLVAHSDGPGTGARFVLAIPRVDP